MASEDPQRCDSINSLLKEGNPHIEQMLLDIGVRYADKIQKLATAWTFLRDQRDREDHANTVMRSSVQLILRAEWKTIATAAKHHLKMQVHACGQKNEALAARCHSILQLLDDPWGDQVLKNIFQDKSIDDSAALKFLESDRYILRTRLNTLCEDKNCFELAQKLAAVVWLFYKRDRNLLSFFLEEDLHYILDLHLILLVRLNKQNLILSQMKELPLQQGSLFIKRLKQQHHYPSDKNKLWKKSRKALEIVVQLLATRAIREPFEDVRSTINDLMAEWVEMFCLDPEFKVMIGKLASLSISVDHLFALTNALELRCHGKHRLKCIEFFIKRLTSEVNQMNDLRNLGNEAQLRAAEEHLSTGFLQLADLLSDNLKSCRECVLTAFSLNPTPQCLHRLQDLAVSTGMLKKEVLDTGQSGEHSQSAMNDGHVPMEIKFEEGNNSTQLPETLQDDLLVVLKSPRNRTLNWDVEWPDLKKRCEEHFQEMMRGERPAMKELKYLELDYSLFKHLRPEDENHDGIEKGYEIDSSTADEDCDDMGGSNHRSLEAGSDPSLTIKKKIKPSDPTDPRVKKSKIPRTPKPYLSPEESRSKININETLLSKKKSQRKPKGKTPKSDAKRSRKSSFTQFQVSSGKDMGPLGSPPGGNYQNISPEDFNLLVKKNPRNQESLAVLKNYRHPKKALGVDHHLLGKMGPHGHGQCGMVPGLNSLDMMVPGLQSTTVQVVHVSGNVPPRTASSTITRPEDEAASTDQVNGKPPQAQAQAGGSGQQQQATYINQSGNRVTVQLMSGAAPGLAPLTNSRVMVRPGLTPARTWAPGPAATTTLPQFSTAFGAAAGSSALKQALLAPSADKQQQHAKPNPPPTASATQTAAGFGSHTQPAGFGAPAHPPGPGSGFGTPTQPTQASPTTTTPLPPLQARQTPLSPTSLQPQQEPPTQPSASTAQQAQPPQPQQMQTFTVAGAHTTATTAPPPTPTGTPTPPSTTTTTTGPVIVTTSTGAIMNPTPPPGLLLVATSTAAPQAAPQAPTTTPSPSTTSTPSSTSTGLTLARSVVTVTNTKAPTGAAVLVAGLTAQHRPPAVPTLVQRTFSSLDKTIPRGSTVQIVQAVGQAGQGGQAVKLAVVPALVPSSAQQHLAAVTVPPGVTAVAVSKRGVGPPARTRVSNPILGKYLKQQGDATTPPSSTATPTTPPGAAAAAAAATAAARAEAANAPTNVSRPLYASTTPPSANDTLKEQLLEFESVLHHVHTTRQLKERQSLDQDDPRPQPQSAPTTPVQAAPAPAPATTPASTPTPATTPAPPLVAVAVVTTSTGTPVTTTVVARPVHTDVSVQAAPQAVPQAVPQAIPQTVPQVVPVPQSLPQAPRPPTAQAATISHATTQTVVRAVPVSGAVPVSLAVPITVHKSIIPVSVAAVTAVSSVSSVSLSLAPTVTLSAPKKKPKLGKTLTVVAAPGTTVVATATTTAAAAPTPLPVPTTPTPAVPTTTVATQPQAEQRQFKPNVINTLSTAKHLNQKSAEDEQMTARIMSILKQYDEQLRCSPEINNKPAPRRRNQVQPGAAASPTNKRKHKNHKKGSVSELSPGTDDTHTMGSEDSSIASHFADGVMDGVMEATPTSPLSTCDERSLASAAATTGDTTALPAAPAATPVTSFAGLTKATTTTTESDRASESGPKVASPIKGPTLIKVQTPPKVQVLAKVAQLAQLAPVSMPQPLPKAPVAVSSPIMLPVALSMATTSKAVTPTKIVTTTAGKVQMLAKVSTPQTPPSLLKTTTTLPKVRPLVKTQTLPKVQQLAPLVMLSPTKPGETMLTSPQGVVVQTSKENQIFTVSSRVIQSVESIKPSENPALETAPPLQVTDQVLQLAPASSQVSQLERALQSKHVSQTPLLARALKTPTTHLPTTFTGILSTTTRLSIAQPSSTVQLRALPRVSDGEADKIKLQSSDMPAPVPQLSQTIQLVSVKPEELSPKSSQPVKLSPSPQSSSVSAVLHQGQVMPLQPETSVFNPMTECLPPSTSTTTTTMLTQQVPSSPVVMLPATTVESQLPPKPAAEPLQCNSDLINQSHRQPNGSLLILTSPQPETVSPSLQSDVLAGTQLVQLASQQQASDAGVQEPLLQAQKRQQGVEDVLQVPQSSGQLSLSPVQLAPPPLQMQAPTQNSQAVQQIQLAPQGMANSAGQVLEEHLTQADLLQPTLQMESASDVGLQAIPQTMQQILEPLPQAQLNSQIVHSLTQEQILQPAGQMQQSTQILQISQAPPTSTIVQTVPQVSSMSQIVIPTSQILQTTSQAQLVETAQMSQIITSAPQLVQSLPQLVQSSKSTQSAQQRFGIQPVQLSATSTGQIRRIVHQAQVSGDCTPQLVQISQPQLIQAQQLQSTQQLLMPPSSQAVTVSLAGTYTPQNDEAKVTSPSKQNLLPLYMVPSSSASQLPVMISSATGMVHVNLVNSQAGPVVVRQVAKQDGKLTRDSSHDIISVISCDSSQPLLLSSIQQLFGGNPPVVSTSALGAAMTTQTTPTVVASSAPMFSVANVVDSSVVTDTSVLTLNPAPVSSEIPVNVSNLISSSVSPAASQIFQTLTTTNQTTTSVAILEAPAPAPPVSPATPRAATPSTASSIPPLTNTSPTSAPNRPTTLLALQMQQRSKQLRQKEEEEKQLEMQQKIQQLKRLTQQHQQQQPQQLAPQSDLASQPQAVQEIPQVVQLESPTQPLPGLQPTTQVVLLTQREASKSPQKQPTRINVSPQKVKDEALEKFPVIIPRTKSRPTLLSSPPQYKTTEPKHLRHLLDTPPAPLPPLYQTGVRRLSNATLPPLPAASDQTKIVVSPVKQEDQIKVENHQEKQIDVKPETIADSVGSTQQNAESNNPTVKPSCASTTAILSPLRHTIAVAVSPEKLSGSTEEGPMPQLKEEILSASLPETPPPEKLSTLSPDKLPGNFTPEKSQLPTASPIRRLSFDSSTDSKVQLTPEKQTPTSLSAVSTEKGSPLSSPEKLSTTPVSELPSPSLVPLRVLPATSPEKQLLQTPKSSKPCPQTSPKQCSPKGKKSPKIYAVTKTIAKQASPVKIPQKIATTKSQLTSNMKSMVLTHSGLEALTSIGDAVVLGQQEHQPESETLFIRANVPHQSPTKGTDVSPTSDVPVTVVTTPTSVKGVVAKSGETNYQRLVELPDGTRRPQSQLPKLNLLTKLTATQPLGQTVQQGSISEAPPLVPMSACKPVESAPQKSFQLIDDTGGNSKGLLSELPAHLCLDSKPASSEVRVYPPSQGSIDSDKVGTKSKIPPVSPVSAPPLLLTSTSSPAKATTTATVQVSYSALKSSDLKIQMPTQGCLPSLTTIPLQVPRPVPAKAQAVTHERQTLLSPDALLKLQTATSTVQQNTSPVSSTSKTSQEDATASATPRPKRQRNRKKSSSQPQEKESTSQSTGEAQQSSPKKSVDSEASPTKRPQKKKDAPGATPVTPEIVSQHLSDTIMRVSLGEDEPETTANEEINTTVVKDEYEDQEKIPVEVAVAALCGEDIENAKDLLEGNLQGDIEASGAITLLPADPSESTEELNFFRNVVENIPEDTAKSDVPNDALEAVDSVSLNETKDTSAISSLIDAVDIDTSIVKKEPSLASENKEDEPVLSRISHKRKAAGSHSGSFSEHSRSISESDDLSMDKTSTSDIFPETDILLETTFSPSFLGEIDQLSPTNSQDAVCASPEPLEKRKRGMKSLSKQELEENKGASKSLSSIGSLSQFNGGNLRSEMAIGDNFKHAVIKQECSYLDSTMLDNPAAHMLDDRATMSKTNQTLTSLAGSSTVSPFLSFKSGSSGDEASWEKEPLFVQSSDNEEEPFWGEALASDVDIDLSQEGDTNSSTPSETLSKSLMSSGRSSSQRPLVPQTRKAGVKRKEDSASSPSQKQLAEKRKRVSSLTSNEEDEGNSKYGQVLRSSTKPSRREGVRGAASKEDTIQRRVSTRTHKPVTKFDDPPKRAKPTQNKQPPKTVTNKKK